MSFEGYSEEDAEIKKKLWRNRKVSFGSFNNFVNCFISIINGFRFFGGIRHVQNPTDYLCWLQSLISRRHPWGNLVSPEEHTDLRWSVLLHGVIHFRFADTSLGRVSKRTMANPSTQSNEYGWMLLTFSWQMLTPMFLLVILYISFAFGSLFYIFA